MTEKSRPMPEAIRKQAGEKEGRLRLVQQLRVLHNTILTQDGLAQRVVANYNKGKTPDAALQVGADTKFFVALREPEKGEITAFIPSVYAGETKVISLGIENPTQTSYIGVGDVLGAGESGEFTLRYVKVIDAADFKHVDHLAQQVVGFAATHEGFDMGTVSFPGSPSAKSV